MLKVSFPGMGDQSEPPKHPLLEEDQGARPRAGTPSPPNLAESTRGGGDGTQTSGDSRTSTRDPVQKGEDSTPGGKQGGQLSRRGSTSKGDALRGDIGDGNSRIMTPALPQAPTNCFGREEVVGRILDFTDQIGSVALFGPIGIGKSTVALTLLHHDRTEAKFGQHRYFLQCDNLTNSPEGFLERLSDAVHTERTTSMAQLRSQLKSSPPLILLLDGVDPILDPLTTETQEISAMIEEFGNYEHVCLVTTSRLHLDLRGFDRVEVPTLSQDSARDAFYSLCHLGRSPAVDDIITQLDFHPLSIDLLAGCVRENSWDEPTLLKTWSNDQTGALKIGYHRKLKDAMEPALRSPTIVMHGTIVLDVLETIAASPRGVEERELKKTAGAGKIIEVLSKFSLVYHQDRYVRMLSPVRSCVLEVIPAPAQRKDSIWDGNMPGACTSFSSHPLHSHGVTRF